MQREIKFRGQSQLGLKPLVKGFLFIDECDKHYIVYKPKGDDFQYCPVFEESVGQFTGLTDKNGTEIYEGDIINSFQNDGKPVEVYYDDQLAGFATQNYHSTLYLSDSIGKECQVIGNIHQHPHLLE